MVHPFSWIKAYAMYQLCCVMAEELIRTHQCETYYFICYNFLGGGDIYQVRKQNQTKTTKGQPTAETQTLRLLDADILALVAEEVIRGEIEQADFARRIKHECSAGLVAEGCVFKYKCRGKRIGKHISK